MLQDHYYQISSSQKNISIIIICRMLRVLTTKGYLKCPINCSLILISYPIPIQTHIAIQ